MASILGSWGYQSLPNGDSKGFFGILCDPSDGKDQLLCATFLLTFQSKEKLRWMIDRGPFQSIQYRRSLILQNPAGLLQDSSGFSKVFLDSSGFFFLWFSTLWGIAQNAPDNLRISRFFNRIHQDRAGFFSKFHDLLRLLFTTSNCPLPQFERDPEAFKHRFHLGSSGIFGISQDSLGFYRIFQHSSRWSRWLWWGEKPRIPFQGFFRILKDFRGVGGGGGEGGVIEGFFLGSPGDSWESMPTERE